MKKYELLLIKAMSMNTDMPIIEIYDIVNDIQWVEDFDKYVVTANTYLLTIFSQIETATIISSMDKLKDVVEDYDLLKNGLGLI